MFKNSLFKKLYDLISKNGDMQEFSPFPSPSVKVLKPKNVVQLWLANGIGWQFSDARTLNIGPFQNQGDHSLLLHVDWIGEASSEVGKVIMASAVFDVYGMARGGGRINFEIRSYHFDLIKRITEVHFLKEKGRVKMPFGFKQMAP
jgi:hypothetical protein